jgi:hypothetical protein
MKIITTFGVIVMVLGFLASALGAFPLADMSASTPIYEDTLFSKQAVEQAAGQVARCTTRSSMTC